MKTQKILSAVSGLVLVTGLAAGCSTTERPKTQLSEAEITSKIKSKLATDPDLHNIASIDVDTTNGCHVRLSGGVGTEAERIEAEKQANKTEGVCSVANDIEVSAGRTAGQTLDDGVITSKVKAKLAANGELNPFNIDVDTRHGVVTLSGRVHDTDDKRTAERVAKETSGVREVKNEIMVGSDADVDAGHHKSGDRY